MKKIKKRAVWLLAVLLLLPCSAQIAHADVVTDYLSVKVGYYGMELSDYVEVGTYHWSELYDNLPMYSLAYSYYQEGNGNQFTAVVDSANGFLVTDILNYAQIYYGDIYNLKLYVEDHNGIQASFDRDALFQTRYYFRDFPYNARYYDENGAEILDPSRCWNDCEEVPPMLAMEDNWASFTEEFDHALPDFNYMTAGNRFRLLFGQTSPTESMTSSSAKYVSCIYVTLNGAPVYGDIPELDGSYGSHEVTLTVQADNESIRNAMSELLRLGSDNEEVMRIIGYTVTPDEFYSDVAHVTVQYEIVGEGTASFTASVGGQEVENPGGYTRTVEAEAPEEQPGTPSDEQPPDADDPAGEEPVDAPAADPDGEPETSSFEDYGTDPGTGGNAASPNGNGESSGEPSQEHTTATGTPAQEHTNDSVSAVDSVDAPDAETVQNTSEMAKINAYALSEEAAARLFGWPEDAMVTTDPDQAVTQVAVEDTSEDKAEEQKRWYVRVGLGSSALLAVGIVFGEVSFRRKLKRER